MRYLIILLCLLPSFASFGQLINGSEDESKMYAETKQVNQFFRRFNGEEDEKGNRYYPKDRMYRDPKLRKKYIDILFDASNTGISSSLKNKFSQDVIQNDPFFLDFHGGNWFAEVHTIFRFQGKDQPVTLFLKLEKDHQGYKWVINKAYASFLADFMARDTVGIGSFLHPMSHELDFMNLKKAMTQKDSVEQYVSKEYTPDYLSLMLYEIKRGNLVFKTVNRVYFHVFQMKDWYFKLSEFNRPGYNTGWLISDLTQVQDRDKDILLRYIYNEK